MGLDLGAIGASVKLNTAPLAADVAKAKAMFSGLDKSLAASGGMKNAEKGLAGLGNQLAGFGGSVPKAAKGLAGLGNEFATLSYFGGSAKKTLGDFGKSLNTGGMKNAEKGIGGIGKKLNELSGFGGSATNALGGFGKQLGVLGTIGVVAGAVIGLGAAFYSCAKAAEEEQKINAQTNAVIASTGGVANVTADHVNELGDSLAQLSGVSHDTIKSAENIMLTFRGVANIGKNKIFDEAIKSTLDMSIALKKDLNDSAIKVGKALQDPVKGLTALRRYGVMFTDEQVTMAKQMVATGHTMDAQKMILEELKTEFGGSAEAFGGTLAGQIGKLKDSWDKFKESIGNTSLPTLTGFLKVLNDISKVKFPDKFAPKIEITTNAGQAVKEAQKALAAFDKGMAAGGIISVLAKVDRTELINAKQEIDNLGKDVPEIVLRFRDVGLAGTTQKEVQGMIKMMADYEPTMRESGIKLFKGIMDAEAYSHPEIAKGMGEITSEMTDKIMGMKTGDLTQAKMNEIVQAEVKAHPECDKEMNLIMATLNQILAGPVTPPNIPPPTASDPIPVAQGVIGQLRGYFGANPASPVISGVIDQISYSNIVGSAIGKLQALFDSRPASPRISTMGVQLSPMRIFSSAAAAGEYIAQELSGGINAGMSKNPAGIILSGGSAMSDLTSATALANASFGNFISAMNAEPLNEVNDAIMRLTANNTSSLGDWWKLRGAYDAATKSLASYESQIKTAEAAVTSLEGKIEKANAARERPSMVMDKESTELQLAIMKAEDLHQYALVNKLNIQKDALDRTKEELDLTTSIADKTKELKDTSAFKGKTTAQIDAMIATWSAALLKKTSQVAALKVTYDKVQTSVDKFKKIIDDLSAYFTSKSPAPAGYAGGTSYVPQTGLAMVHKGEQIIPAKLNPLTLGSGSTTLITVPLYLDGKLIAKSVSRYQGGQANSRAMSGGRY